MFGVAFVAGPLIGGYLTEHAGWHWIFYVNIPIGIVALAVIQRLLPTVKARDGDTQLRHPRRRDLHDRDDDPADRPDLQGPDERRTSCTSGPTAVGGLILFGLIGYVLFVLAEARAKEPIVPLDLFRSRAYSASMVSIFFAAFAFFGAIVFLPRWFQVVQGFSPTNSGLAALPLVVGLICSSIGSGLIVARTGRYKLLLVGAIATLGLATALMTQLTKDTPLPIVWFWMFLAGLGVGPTFSVFTIVDPELGAVPPDGCRHVQPDVLPPDRRLGRPGVRRHDLRRRPSRTTSSRSSPRPACPGTRPVEGAAKPAACSISATSSGSATSTTTIAKFRTTGRRTSAHRPGHLRGLQPRRRPDVLPRRLRCPRRADRGPRDQGAPAPRQQLVSGVGRGPGREACPQPRVTRRPASDLRGPAALRVAGPSMAG